VPIRPKLSAVLYSAQRDCDLILWHHQQVGGRWSLRDNEPVLYTSLEQEGALAEISFHWSCLTPLPSKPVVVHRIQVSTERTLRLKRVDLSKLGVDMNQFGSLNYSKCQEIGAAVGFLECDGLIVPSARWKCENLVLFTNYHNMLNDLNVLESTDFIWQDWAREKGFID
jgi:hypothetical protein